MNNTDVEVAEATSPVSAEGQPVEPTSPRPAPAGVQRHPTPAQYVLIAVVLVIVTGLEIATSYLDGDVNSNLLITVLGVMAAMKFFLVAAWYMHMRMDAPFFRRLFVIGMAGATIVYGAVMLTFASTVLRQ